LISENDIERVARDAVTYGCATASTPVYDTVKQVAKDGRISATVDRSVLRAVQTPQCMPLSLYKEAIASVTDLSLITDDNMMLESIGSHPFCSDTSANNIKITTPEDIVKAEYILSANKKI
jgi:2-C-methyl-D-erythritol 4-phosphate cytidylyltransferase